MKRILWICNTPLPEIQNMVGVKNYNEGWLVGISNQLRKKENIIFHYAFPQNICKRTLNRTIDGITFWGFYNYHQNSYKIEKSSEHELLSIINKVKPDIIHIFGTEFPHSLECIKIISDRKKTIVSLQGLVSELACVYTKGIPFKERLMGKFEATGYQCLLTDNLDFYKRGINEKRILLNIENVIGRTAWDKKCVRKWNSRCRYYHCNETLRDVFYEDAWNIETMQRHSIFVSQAYYPIKGFHILISALVLIRKKYPDVKVYVAGDREFLNRGTPYGNYIKKIIKKYGVEKNIVFLGPLLAEKMKQILMQSHVALMPSLLENSPNSIGEAMLLGVPVVAADVGGIPSILSNNNDGYLYQSTDKGDLAKKVCKIFADDNLALKFSINSRNTAKRLYDKSNNINQLLKIYGEIIRNKKGGLRKVE